MPGDLSEALRGVPPPWDEFTCRQILFLRHRLAKEYNDEIAVQYGISESAVRHALGRMARTMLVKTEPLLLMLASEAGIQPLKLRDVGEEVGCAGER